MIAFAAGMLLVLAAGEAAVRALAPRLRGAALAGASILTGSGLCALVLFVLAILRVPWTRTAVAITVLALTAVAVWLSRRRGRPAAQPRAGYGAGALVLDLGALAVTAAHLRFALGQPLFEWDWFAIWGLKAKTFFEMRGIDWTWVRAAGPSHPDYPPLVPLAYDFFSVIGGAWNERAVALWSVAVCAALLLVVRGVAASELGSQKLAAAVTLAVASPAMNVWIGLGEPAVMAFGCAGLILLRRGFREEDEGAVRLGAILLGLAAWSKNEGLALVAVAAVAVFALRRRWRDVLALWPAAAVVLPWMIVRRALHLQTDFLGAGVIDRVLARLRDPDLVVAAFTGSPPDQPWLWLVVAAVLLLYARERFARERLLFFALAAQAFLMMAQALATRVDFTAHVSLTMNRIPQQILPAAVFLAAMLIVSGAAPREAMSAAGDEAA